MIKGNRINDHEFVEVVFERNVISMPSYHVERTVVLLGYKQLTVILAHDLVIDFTILVPRYRRLKIPWVRQAIRSCCKIRIRLATAIGRKTKNCNLFTREAIIRVTYRPQFGQLKVIVVHL